MASKCKTFLKEGDSIANTNYNVMKTSLSAEIMLINTVCPIPVFNNENKFIVTAIDHFTKLDCCKAIPQKFSECVSKFIKEDIITVFPKIKFFLLCNRLEFKSLLTQKVTKTNKIEWKFEFLYYLQTQNPFEKFNDRLIEQIKKLCNYEKKPWDSKFKAATASYNNSF
jgi:hypothetical protein